MKNKKQKGISLEAFREFAEIRRIANKAVREAVEENKKLELNTKKA